MSVYLKCCINLSFHRSFVDKRYRFVNAGMAEVQYQKLVTVDLPAVQIQNWSNTSYIMTSVNDSGVVQRIPEGYSVPHIILTSILVSIIMFVIVFGNLLVVIAIFTDKTLKTTQNWFIASLAVADFLLGLVIMPFSLANEMMGYWFFGHLWCDLWKAIDVLLCTASILSICLISLDRYWSITRALEYSRQRTPTRASLMIAAVWFLSAVICVPPLIGWKNPLPVSDYPLCLLSDDIGYVLYSTMGSFYIPCVIMVFVYFKIYRAARNLARKNIRKKEKNKSIRSDSPDDEDLNTCIPDIETDFEQPNIGSEYTANDSSSLASIDEQRQRSSKKLKLKLVNSNLISTDLEETDSSGVVKDNTIKEIEKPNNTNDDECHQLDKTKISNGILKDARNSMKNKKHSESDNVPVAFTEENKNTRCDKSKKHTERLISMRKLSDTLSKKRHKQTSSKANKGWRTASLREHERHKRKLAKARERRATIVLGLVMAAFILCWFPFFTLYIITSFCYCVGEIVFAVVFWAGYCNSALNPIIYTVFNRDFRQAFHRIICTNLRRCR